MKQPDARAGKPSRSPFTALSATERNQGDDMDATEAHDRAAKTLAEAEHHASVNPEAAKALVAVADGWSRLAHAVNEAAAPVVNVHIAGSVRSERELDELIQRELRRGEQDRPLT
jgi:hypothetical protein